VFAITGTWAVLSGTDAYARLRGHGAIDAAAGLETFFFTFTGTTHSD
jgi:hypothetical protein